MKALLINGSPRPNGCTFTALTELAKTLEQQGIETESVHVGSKDIRGCIACRRCHAGLNKYFTISGMPIASSQYWNMVYGGSAEEVLKDAEGLQTMRTLGRNIAFLAKSIQLGKERFGLPEKEPAIFTNFHH